MMTTHKKIKLCIHSYGLMLLRSYGLLALLLFFTTGLFAQTDFFYSPDGEKVVLKLKKDMALVKHRPETSIDTWLAQSNFTSSTIISNNLVIVSFDSMQMNLNNLKQNSNILDAVYALENAYGSKQIPTNVIIIKLKVGNLIEELFNSVGLIQYVEEVELFNIYENIYVATLNIPLGDVMLWSRSLFETGKCDFATPSFLRNLFSHDSKRNSSSADFLDNSFSRSNGGNSNPFFEYQWGLKNTGPSYFFPFAVADMDIRAEDAWKITKGIPDIKIAVLDERVQLDHPDLEENILRELVYDATQYPIPPPSPNFLDYRGTCWAGIIAAADNDIGIIGVAPKCKIVPVRIGNFSSSSSNKGIPFETWTDEYTLMKGIHYAWHDAKVDVIHCSWGWSDDYLGPVYYELQTAATQGRDGKGCVIVAPSGDNWLGPGYGLDAPARYPFVLGVGAIDLTGRLIIYSQCGTTIDFVAPGHEILSTFYDNEYYFLSAENYYYPLLGYESLYASAFVAGVAALVLSANPCLTSEEVKKVIALSCEQYDYKHFGNDDSFYFSYFQQHKYGKWNNEMGYGLVNANKSVKYALSLPETFDLSGNVVSISNPLNLSIKNNWVWNYGGYPYFDYYPFAAPDGTYNVKRHEVTTTVQFDNNYPLPPLVQGIANGFSDNPQNNGRCFMEVVNVMETDATVRTYVYEVINPGHIKWIPTHPDSVRFHIAVMRDNLHNELFLQNEVEPTTKNYTAITTIAAGKNVTPEKPIGDYVIRSGGSVGLHAGESITLADGFHAQAGSFFKTHIEPFFICDYKAPAPAKSGGNEPLYVISDYSVEKTGVDKVVRDYMKIYPNPSAGGVTIEYNLSLSELVEITLHDNSGKLVYKLRNRTPHEAGVYKITFSGVELPNGIYLCTLKTETGQKTEKLIIAK